MAVTLAVWFALRANLWAAASPPPEQSSVRWDFVWQAALGEPLPAVSICPLLYDKKWAYAVEIDDGPVSTLGVAQPLLAEFNFTDAPPGLSGGHRHPFVGGAAVIVERSGTPNASFLNWSQLRQLQTKGWGVLNHSYWHSGNSWDPKAAMSVDQIKQDLFWSQTILASELGESQATTHLVYPNGYMPFELYLAEFGLQSGSRVGGRLCNLLNARADLHDIDRNYLDEPVWSKETNALWGLPKTPQAGDLVIDFTHGIQAGAQSPNQLRWRTRLGSIASRFGEGGSDEMWCAPTAAIINYIQTMRASLVESAKGHVTLTVTNSLPTTPLTIKIAGISPLSKLGTPRGSLLFRQNETVWITTPPLGVRKSTVPTQPKVERVYSASLDAQNPKGDAWHIVKFDRPTHIAAVRVLQHGEVHPGFELIIKTTASSGKSQILVNTPLKPNWGAWLLFPIVPTSKAQEAIQLELSTDPGLKAVEVWAGDSE